MELNTAADIEEQLPGEISGSGSQLSTLLKLLFIPFGFYPGAIWHNIQEYIINLLWWIFVPGSVGGLFILFKKHQQKIFWFTLWALGIATLLIFQYGSWAFEDMLTLQLNKIGISYVRYWLPLYILLIPLGVYACSQLLSRLSRPGKIMAGVVLSSMFLALNINTVYFAGHDSIPKIMAAYDEYAAVQEEVLMRTENHAIIVTERGDKIFFPHRQVIAKWEDENIDAFVRLLNEGESLYWYGFESDDQVAEVESDSFLNELELHNLQQLSNGARLFKIELAQQ